MTHRWVIVHSTKGVLKEFNGYWPKFGFGTPYHDGYLFGSFVKAVIGHARLPERYLKSCHIRQITVEHDHADE